MTSAYKEKGSTVDENEIKRVLQRAPEIGCPFLDTSDLYGCADEACQMHSAMPDGQREA